MEPVNTQQFSRYERKKLEREERENTRTYIARKKRIVRWLVLALVLAGIGGSVVLWARSVNKHTVTGPGKHFSNQGREHVKSVDVKKYNSVPPTSGPHFDSQTNWGIHKESIPEGYQVHNLEHGGILMQYKPGLAQDMVEKLKAVGESYDWKKIILAPYEKMDTKIALTAWTYLDTFDEFDEARIRRFIDAYRNHGPENVPDNMQSVTLP